MPAQPCIAVLKRAERKILADIQLLQDRDGLTRLSCRELAELTGISKATAGRCVVRLNDLGLIQTKNGTSARPTIHRFLERGPLWPELVSDDSPAVQS